MGLSLVPMLCVCLGIVGWCTIFFRALEAQGFAAPRWLRLTLMVALIVAVGMGVRDADAMPNPFHMQR